ncbi:MAG: antitoxin Xre/MbcA/ParS toxin-binding domain-containing protein [Bacteroidota bacterium]
MSVSAVSEKASKSSGAKVTRKPVKKGSIEKFSPTWVVKHAKDAPDYQLQLINRIRSGVKKSEWKQLISSIGLTEKELEVILPSSISSMQKKEVYDKETSERIYELARLYGLGYEVFDSKEDFKIWLLTPSPALGNKKPFELLDSSFGFEMVGSEITRIQYNVYS